jgi:hypothetical protein
MIAYGCVGKCGSDNSGLDWTSCTDSATWAVMRKIPAGGTKSGRCRNPTSAQLFGWAVTEDREGTTPSARGRGSVEVREHPDVEVGDPSQLPIICDVSVPDTNARKLSPRPRAGIRHAVSRVGLTRGR